VTAWTEPNSPRGSLDDVNARVREIVETAVRDLIAVGMQREGAAMALAVQGAIRLCDQHQIKSLRQMIDDDLIDR